MLTKLLITALVIAACFAYLRFQSQRAATGNRQNANAETATRGSLPRQFRWLAAALIISGASAVIGFFIFEWFNGRTVLTVDVINPQTGELISYEVYKRDLQDRSFKTLNGQQIRISNNERIEITEAP